MEPEILRDLNAARRFVAEGLWLQRAVRPNPATAKAALEWAYQVAHEGHPLPPVGFIGDIGHIALGADAEHRGKDLLHVPGWPAPLARMYEDHVLGKLYSDSLFERAGDALQKLQGKDRVKGLAYLVHQMQGSMKLPGVELPPAVIRGLLQDNVEEVLSTALERLQREGPSPRLVAMYEQIVSAFKRSAELLVGSEDRDNDVGAGPKRRNLRATAVEALEDRSALGDVGQLVALNQIRNLTRELLEWLPTRPIPPALNRREVPTRVLDEDEYPVGGYTSIATKGSIESLLHSQLAYIEDNPSEPDLFDVKFARDELFYYSRDENQFLRRRRAFVFVLYPDLLAARFKGAGLPYQPIVLIQSAILAVIGKLQEWLRPKESLSRDSLRFEVVFVQDGEKRPLAEEAQQMRLLLRNEIQSGGAGVIHITDAQAALDHIHKLAALSQVHVLTVATAPVDMQMEDAVSTELVVKGPSPQLSEGEKVVDDDAFEVWKKTVKRVLELWV